MASYENLYPDQSEVEHYEATRYAARDQRFISRREQGIICEALAKLPAPRKTVLDAPCGYGRFSEHLTQLGLIPVNADISTPMIARTRDRLLGAGVKTHGVTVDLFQGLPLRPGSVDGALSVRMLHNWPEREKRVAVLKSFAEVVSDWLVITFYSAPVLHRLQFAVRRRMRPQARQSMAMISKAEFQEEAREAGFRVESMTDVLPVLHAQTVAVLRRL